MSISIDWSSFAKTFEMRRPRSTRHFTMVPDSGGICEDPLCIRCRVITLGEWNYPYDTRVFVDKRKGRR